MTAQSFASRKFKSGPSKTLSHNKSSTQEHGAIAGMPLFLKKKTDSAAHPHPGRTSVGLNAAISRTRGEGSALPEHTRQQFESAFSNDLSGVRVHDHDKHHQLAQALNARAFTVGSDIFFAEGNYHPGSRDGDRLLAHELAHVVQQSAGQVQAQPLDTGIRMSEANDRYEQEADRAADSIVAGNSPAPIAASNGIYRSSSPQSGLDNVIQRDEDDEDQQGLNVDVLPPSLDYRNGPFGISADTSAARLRYFNDEGETSLGYQYGGDLFYGANMGDFRTRFGLNPQTGVGSLSLGGSHGGFRYGLSGNTAGTFGLNLGYGAPLLPMPWQLGQQAGAAWQGVSSVGGAIPDFVSDPMAAYDANREQIGAIGTFGRSLGQIYGQQGEGGLPFGAGLSLSYNPEQRWVLGAGIQGSF